MLNVVARGASTKTEVSGVRVIDRIALDASISPYLGISALSKISGLSVRKLRDCLADPFHPLPHFRVGGKILVRYADFERWIERYRAAGTEDLDRLVKEVVTDLGR